MYSEGLGYQFTVCDSGIGPYILNDRKGTELDLNFLNMAFNQTGFNNLPWNRLIAAVDAYCLSQGGGNVSGGNITLEEAQAINVNWAAWLQER